VTSLDLHHGADEVVAAFFFDQAADEQDDGVQGTGAKRVGGEEVQVDPDGEDTEFHFGHATLESLAADVFGDADEETGAGAEFRFATQVDAAWRAPAKGVVGAGGVVAMERDDEGDIELRLQRKGGSGVDGEVRVQERGAAEPEGANELRSDAGSDEEAPAEFVREIVVARENERFAGVERKAGGDEAKAGKAGREAAQGMGLGGDKGLGWGQEIGTVDQDSRVHGIS
jgi:hypothetical protein